MNKSIVIGITGPTGSGKSTIAKMIEQMGYELLDVDCIAKSVIQDSASCINDLKNEFSSNVINEDGSINRAELFDRAFSSKDSLKRLNEIVHPEIVKKLEGLIDNIKMSGKNVVVDAAVLFESGADKLCDFTISVLAPKRTRTYREIYRDGISRTVANKRINAQQKDSFYKENADYILDGSKNVLSLYSDIKKIILNHTPDLNEN